MMSDRQDTFDSPPQPLSLRRWSQRKLDAARSLPSAGDSAAIPPDVAPLRPTPATTPATLPPVESLTFDSEFAPFLKPEVDEALKRAALKQLFRHPRFNIMDGLDTYIDDYTKADPIPPAMLSKLVHARYIFDPPQTELTTEGHVIDKLLNNPAASATFAPAAAPSAEVATGVEMVPTPVPATVDADVKADVARASANGAMS
jgi:hypothetical protein